MNDRSEHNDKDQYDKYQSALEHLRYEGQLLWQIFTPFLLAHTVFLAFLLPSALQSEQIVGFHPGVFFAAIAGLLLWLPWRASYQRSSHYYEFRMAQVKEIEPRDWNLLRGRGEQFAEGQLVCIEGKRYQIGWLARVLRTKRSTPLLIVFFAVFYAIILILSGPWW